jgi:hypothetical protein
MARFFEDSFGVTRRPGFREANVAMSLFAEAAVEP